MGEVGETALYPGKGFAKLFSAPSPSSNSKMRGILLVCGFYAIVPLAFLFLCSLMGSGFPVFPIATGVAIWAGTRNRSRQSSHF